jgi:adenylosuccinate lyase
MGEGASQVTPRTHLALWASAAAAFAAACSKIATDLRLMHLLGEVHMAWGEGQIGSSAMAHKRNPIVAEQLTGMARVVQGYASMLQPLDLWLERDISNSSVERIAVPAIWHLLFHVTKQTTELLRSMQLDENLATERMADNANALWTHKITLESIRSNGMSYDEAREYALEFDIESYDIMGDARWFTRNYPNDDQVTP